MVLQCKQGHALQSIEKRPRNMQWQIKPFAPERPLDGPLELTIAFFFPIPKSASKAVRLQMINRVILPDKKPDADNLAYLVTNALKEIVYDDDRRVVAQHFTSFTARTQSNIRVRPILQAEPLGYRDMDYLE